MGDENFFAMPPAEEAPAAPPADAPVDLGVGGEEEAGGFTLLGDAPPAAAPAPFVGDVDETPAGDAMGFADAPPPDAGFAAPPSDFTAPPDAGFAAPPDAGFAAPPDDGFAAPPAEDTPIILGDPSGEDPAAEPESSEPSPMQKFNAEWQEILKERKDEENAKKAELVEAARVSMENFQKERENKRETRMAKNREDEQAKLEAIEADLENDNSWQRVCKMVELTHDGAEDGQDVKRMRDVMILLKNEPARAAAVGA